MPRKRRAAPPALTADAFLIADASGRYWTGEDWSRDWDAAILFRQEPSPYLACREECDRLTKNEGVRCIAVFLFRTQAQRHPRYNGQPPGAGGRGSG